MASLLLHHPIYLTGLKEIVPYDTVAVKEYSRKGMQMLSLNMFDAQLVLAME